MTVSASMSATATATTPPMMAAVLSVSGLTLSARQASVTGWTRKAMKVSISCVYLATSRDKDEVAVSCASYIASSDCDGVDGGGVQLVNGVAGAR